MRWVIAVLGMGAAAWAQLVHVDPVRGDDAGEGGTPATAVRSLARAQILAREHAAAMRADVEVRLADGELTVRDHGPGVPEAQLAQLAQPFFRPDAARSRSDGGVGLGLYLCRLVAEAHGGRLQLRNAAPGLEVTVTLPKYAI